MNLLKTAAVAGLALTLTAIGPAAFAQSRSWSSAESSYGDTANYPGNAQDANQAWNGNFHSWNANSQSGARSMNQRLRNDINKAADQGVDVSDASYFEQLGRHALENGNRSDAVIDFTIADECLGSWGTMVHNAINQETLPANASQRQRAKALERMTVRDTNRALSNNADVHEALIFENRGLQALQNGDMNQAIKEFRGAQTALGPYASINGNSRAMAANGSNYSMSQSQGQSQWQEARQVRRDINQAESQGLDISSARQFADRGRQALNNGDRNEASQNFNQAETALQQAGFQSEQSSEPNENYGQNESNYGQNQPQWEQARQLRSDINQAESQGLDVSSAQQFATQGRQALDNGDQNEASQDFNQAEAVLQQAGFQSSQANAQSPEANSFKSGSQSGWNLARQVRRDIDQAQAQGYKVNDAFHFESQGRIALENGDQTKASRDFHKAEQELSNAGYRSGRGLSSQG